eukprot:TRINITY_DN44822_c0_g1_i1.p1 TRINITY_DN44822_c0_g1~~TRINITY_DN44822_c0_g1_i1.p1  ORF type:complete len:435 (+),score=62.46 TRINITY_DN44822_c0_g1_i1:106-1410(+)
MQGSGNGGYGASTPSEPRRSSRAAAGVREPWSGEEHILPVFYYNDLLVSQHGEEIGLNLFEPRYREMCIRMQTDPRFVFMPNYVDYQARAGDVGFVIDVTGLQRGRQDTFGIRGHATKLVALTCTWVYPDNRRLHYCAYHDLESPAQAAVSMSVARELQREFQARRWRNPQAQNTCSQSHRLHLYPPGESVGEVIIGANWPDRWFLMIRPSAVNAEENVKKLESLLREACRMTSIGDNAVIHRLPPIPVERNFEGLLYSLGKRIERSCSGDVANRVWSRALKQSKLSSVHGMALNADSAVPALTQPRRHDMDDCMLQCFDCGCPALTKPLLTYVATKDMSTVLFYEWPSYVSVTEASAQSAEDVVDWLMNYLGLAVVIRARKSGHGPLNSLEDNVAKAICDFVATPPTNGRLHSVPAVDFFLKFFEAPRTLVVK